MKRKSLYGLLTCVLLIQPMQALATEPAQEMQEMEQTQETQGMEPAQETQGAEQTQETQGTEPVRETQGMEPADETEGQDTTHLQSVLDEITVGVDKITENDNSARVDIITAAESVSEKDSADTEGITTVENILGTPIGAEALEINKTEEEYAKAYELAKNNNWGYTNLGIANVDNNLNIRSIPEDDGRLVGKLPKNAACEVLDSDGEWAHISSGKVEGYVSCEYLITGVQAKQKAEELASTIATVTADSLKVRAEANTDSEIITLVPRGEELEVVRSEGGWIKVYLDDQEVYVASEYVDVDAKLNTAITMSELLYGQGVSNVRVDLCQYAKEFLGNPYVWGGTSLTKGADCSGFVLSVFKKYGINLPHYSGSQANCGTTIKLSEAQPGDLVFYGNGKRINHVAIYIGNGQVIHASSPKTGIRISNASYRTPLKVVKILQ